MTALTLRQAEVLGHLKSCGVISSGHDRSVLESLENKKLVIRHHNSQGQNVYFTWTLSQAGKDLASQTKESR